MPNRQEVNMGVLHRLGRPVSGAFSYLVWFLKILSIVMIAATSCLFLSIMVVGIAEWVTREPEHQLDATVLVTTMKVLLAVTVGVITYVIRAKRRVVYGLVKIAVGIVIIWNHCCPVR